MIRVLNQLVKLSHSIGLYCCFIVNLYGQIPEISQFTSPHAQSAVPLSQGQRIYQNQLGLFNHVQLGFKNNVSVGLGAALYPLSELGPELYTSVNIGKSLKLSEGEYIRLGILTLFGGGDSYIPYAQGTTATGSIVALYTRNFKTNHQINLGYSYWLSSSLFDYSHLFYGCYKYQIPRSKLTFVAEVYTRSTNENWGFSSWGTIWHETDLRPTVVVNREMGKKAHAYFGLSGWGGKLEVPGEADRTNGFMWPVVGYSRLFGGND